MPNLRYLIFIVLLSLPYAVVAKKRAIVVGGSCEFEKIKQKPMFPGMEMPSYMKSNLAHRPMSRLASGLQKRGFEVNMNYASKHTTDCGSCSEGQSCTANPNMDKDSWSASCLKRDSNLNSEIEENTIENFIKDIDDTASELTASGENSQVLISFITHGMPKGYNSKGSPDGGLSSHGICFSKTGGGYEYVEVDDPRIKGALGKLKKAGAKIGILDHSCYGGETTKLLSDFGCVLSSQTDNNASSAGMGIVNTLNKQLEDDKEFSLSDTFFENHTIKDFKLIYGKEDFGVGSNTNNYPMMSGYDDPLRDFLNDFNYAVPYHEIVLKNGEKNDGVIFSYSCVDMLKHFEEALDKLLNLELLESINYLAIREEIKRITGANPAKLDDLLKDIIEDLNELKDLNLKAKNNAVIVDDLSDKMGSSAFVFDDPNLSKLSKKFSESEQDELNTMFRMIMSDYGNSPGDEMRISQYDFSSLYNKKNLKELKKGFVSYFKNSDNKALRKKRNVGRAFDLMLKQIKEKIKSSPSLKFDVADSLARGKEIRERLGTIKDFEKNRFTLRSKLRSKVKELRMYSLVNAKMKNDFNPDCSSFKI